MPKEWNKMKSKIESLYIVQRKPLGEVIQLMEDKYHFRAR